MADKTNEIGFIGLVEYNGLIKDDFLKEFHGKKAYTRFNEMRLNNAIIGSGLLAIEQVLRSLSWEITSEDDNDPWLEFINESRGNMSQSWNDFISEAISFVWAGFSIFEIIYKYDDSRRLVWRKFATRGQDTVYQWLFDDTGGLSGFRQLAAPKFQAIDIPIEKCILFRTRLEKNNPEGRSLLRIAWVSYYYLKNLQQIEAIGFERDVNGMPVIKLPEGASTSESDTNSDASKAAKIVRNMRVDEQAGLVLPFGWDALLLSGSGKSFNSLAAAIERYEKRIATAFFSQFLLLGQDGVGSMALSENTTDFFMSSVNTIADIVSETFTKYAIYRLLKLNGATDEEAKKIKLTHTPAASINIEKLGTFVSSIKDLLTWDEGDELWLRQLAGAPERDVEKLKIERAEAATIKTEQAKQFAQRALEQDNNSIDVYAADPPDEKRRAKFEKQYLETMEEFLGKQQKRIIKQVKEMQTNRFDADMSSNKLYDFMKSTIDSILGRKEAQNINITMPPVQVTNTPPSVNLSATMPTQSQPNITFAPVIQASPVTPQNNINVQPTPIRNDISVLPPAVNVTVQPAEVKIDKGARTAQVRRDSQGKIISITSDDANNP